LETAIRAKTEPEGRVLSEFASLDQTMPNEGEVIGARLRLLAERGRTEEFIQAFESAEKRGVEPKYRWFYEAWSLAARGMLSQAADLLSREGGDEAGPAAAFALGAIRSAQSRFSEAAGLFQKAASSAADKKARAAALKAKGRALQAAGDQAAAAAAYKAAALEDESDAEAAVLARGLGAAP
jgi:tetratricopeptide (TPR) repeat protein